MNEETNKSNYSGYTNRDGIFLSQIPMKKRTITENLSSEGKFPTISPSNFISLEGMHNENNKNSKIKDFTKMLSTLDKCEPQRKYTNHKKNSSIHLNFSGDKIEMIPFEKKRLEREKETENLKNKIIMKYINYESPKHFTPHNNFFVKLYEFEKNLSLKKYYKQMIEKWKNENKIQVLKGTLSKRVKPEIIKTSLQKEEISLKKIDLLKIFPKSDHHETPSKQRKPRLKEQDFSRIKTDNLLNLDNSEHVHFFPDEINRKNSNNDEKKNEKSKLFGPTIFKPIKKREKTDQEIFIEGKNFQAKFQ